MQKAFIGIDIGSVSAKLIAVSQTGEIIHKKYQRTFGKPAETAASLLAELKALGIEIKSIVSTGSGAKLLEGVKSTNEFKAIALAISTFYPNTRSVFEMGGESSKYIKLGGDSGSTIIDYGINGDCAAGTGSFIDQQAERLHYKTEDVGPLVEGAAKSARVAGRCSVFAKSDMIHAQQKGFAPPEILRGLCLAVARNFKATIVRGRKVEPKVAFIGGLAKNSGMLRAIEEVFNFPAAEIFIPKDAEFIGAIGAALVAKDSATDFKAGNIGANGASIQEKPLAGLEKLSTKNVRFLRDRVKPYTFPKTGKVDAYLGIDIGSVSTNFVVLDKNGEMIMEIYTYTKARPVEVVGSGLKEIEKAVGDKIVIKGVGTTGSGRELIGELIGADVIKDEITAHKTGALHICRRLTGENVDTIFEIGGQDAKYIKIDNGIVTDFAMNEACAAGTGSFLEEQALRLGISIKNEFAKLALSSDVPVPLGERCTVFMERDVNSHQLRGAKVGDIVAGLAYSVATNYLNRVVRGRRVGEHIFFQGGTAYNDAVAAAFSQILGKTITVPPHNGVMGAVGAALLAFESKGKTRFRGFDIGRVNYTMREFTCHACTNDCEVQEFNVENEKTYWGDKCSSRFRKKAHTDNVATIKDLIKFREELMKPQEAAAGRKTIGIPRAMFYFDRFPFWRAYFETLGFNVIASDATNKQIAKSSVELTVSEPCYPIKLVHGHVEQLIKQNCDYIFIPNVLTSDPHTGPSGDHRPIPYLCPWHQTIPWVIKHVPAFKPASFLTPTIQFEFGFDFVERNLKEMAASLGVSSSLAKRALQNAYDAQREFQIKLIEAGREALTSLEEHNDTGIVLVGKPYNIYDMGANLNVPVKLRQFYGINVIPMDFLPVDDVDVTDVSPNMFWNYGRKIIAASKIVDKNRRLHMIYITNFKCGPDSFVKHFSTWASSKPYLTLQFDEHANDAGTVTRVEAYLDSKGLLSAEHKKNTKKNRPQKTCAGNCSETHVSATVGSTDIVEGGTNI